MAAQTLNDFLVQTRGFHETLAKNLEQSSRQTEDERVSLLLDYLQQHEQKLSRAVETIQTSSDHKQLETWFYEYTQKFNAVRMGPSDSFNNMDTDEIMRLVVEQHKQIVELYRYLYGRAGTSPARELLKQLIDLEEHEAMRMAQEGGRSQEM